RACVCAVGVPPAQARAMSLAFSLPIVIVLPLPLEPQPAISPVTPSVASARSARERRMEEALELFTVAQPTGRSSAPAALGTAALGSPVNRARRAGSGALNPQSALAGLNSPPR